MSLSFIKFIKSESGVCLLLAIGCAIFALLLILLIIRDKKKKNEDYTKLNIEKEINASNKETKKPKEEKVVKTKTKKASKDEKVAEEKTIKEEKIVEEKVEQEENIVAEENKEQEKKVKEKPTKTANYHVTKHQSGKWQVKKAGGTKAIKLFDTQAEAISFAKEKSEKQDSNVIIHKKNGKIRKQDYSK